MTTFLDRWNLRPQERRLVVVAGTVLFLMLNMWFVWPHRTDWKMMKDKLERTQTTLGRYTNEIARVAGYKRGLEALEKEGSAVLPAEQAIDMMRTVQRLADTNSIVITYSGQISKSSGQHTNQFFEELSLPIKATTGEEPLVNFLFELGSGNSMIRVKDLTLRPGSFTNLNADITLVASYQRTNVVSKPAVAAAATTRPAPGLAASATAKRSTNVSSTITPNKTPVAIKPTRKGSTNLTAKVAAIPPVSKTNAPATDKPSWFSKIFGKSSPPPVVQTTNSASRTNKVVKKP